MLVNFNNQRCRTCWHSEHHVRFACPRPPSSEQVRTNASSTSPFKHQREGEQSRDGRKPPLHAAPQAIQEQEWSENFDDLHSWVYTAPFPGSNRSHLAESKQRKRYKRDKYCFGRLEGRVRRAHFRLKTPLIWYRYFDHFKRITSDPSHIIIHLLQLLQFHPRLFSAMMGCEMPWSRTLGPPPLPSLFRLPRPPLAVGERRPLAPDMKYPPMPPPEAWLISPAVGTELARSWLFRFWR